MSRTNTQERPVPGPDLEEGISQSFQERLPGTFATASEAMAAAVAVLMHRPDAIGATARRQCLEGAAA